MWEGRQILVSHSTAEDASIYSYMASYYGGIIRVPDPQYG